MSESDVSLSDAPEMVESLDAGGALSEAGIAREDELVRLFIGPNARKYERVLQAAKLKKNGMAWGWCWAAFLMAPVWMLYRKLYIEAIVIIVLPIVVGVLFPAFDSAFAGLGAAIAMFCKPYYLTRARKKIAKIMAFDEPEDVKLALLQRAGGVSWPAGIIGFAIFASVIGLVIAQAGQPV